MLTPTDPTTRARKSLGAATLVTLLLLALLIPAVALADDDDHERNGEETSPGSSYTHTFATYEGTRTCLACHREEALEVHPSSHYQWQGDSGDVANALAPRAGKLGGINDFCVYPDINWIGKMTNAFGKQVPGGCARCHTGTGRKPSPTVTGDAELENIDCLMCHQERYKRKVELVDGEMRYVPDEEAMGMSALDAARSVTRPTKAACLNCHERSGGGPNFKRGDLEPAHRDPGASFDVHMASKASGGAGLDCLSCHNAGDHRIAGRGVDLMGRDAALAVSCTQCHSRAPHDASRLNRHTARVNCNVCHIPQFAQVSATDMERDYSAAPVLDPETGLYEPFMIKRTDVAPEYRFWNGRSEFYQFGQQAQPSANGRVLMAGPLGSIQEAGARIQPMKRHLGRQPIDPLTRRLLPMKMGILFQSGDVPRAIEEGVRAVGWTYNGFDFQDTERYMGIFHEVAPAEEALSCASCHNSRVKFQLSNSRLDFAALGYQPLSTRNGKPLCASCHRDKTDEWKASEFFDKVHAKHVTDKKLDCNSCHVFRKAS